MGCPPLCPGPAAGPGQQRLRPRGPPGASAPSEKRAKHAHNTTASGPARTRLVPSAITASLSPPPAKPLLAFCGARACRRIAGSRRMGLRAIEQRSSRSSTIMLCPAALTSVRSLRGRERLCDGPPMIRSCARLGWLGIAGRPGSRAPPTAQARNRLLPAAERSNKAGGRSVSMPSQPWPLAAKASTAAVDQAGL